MICPRCNGNGQCIECKGEGSLVCATCGGSGKRTRQSGQMYDCSRCKGSGRCACNPKCDPCLGTGQISMETQKVIHEKYTMTTGTPVEAEMGFKMANGLLIAIVGAFIVQQMDPGVTRQLLFLGQAPPGYPGPSVASGAFWQFVSAQFMHGGILHLVMNGLFLFTVGPRLEEVVGSWRFLGIFLLSGIAGFALSFVIQPMTPTLGASGSLFGVAGAIIGLQYRHHLWLSDAIRQFALSLLIWVAAGFIAGEAWNINNWAHVGGGLFGLILGYGMKLRR